MFIFFGIPGSKIGDKKISGGTECPYCQSKNSFVATTYGKYFHIFWIPFLPISKTTFLECSHCKKTYADHELPEDLKNTLIKNNQLQPPKRPIWHGCGCLIFGGLLLLFGIFFIVSLIFWSTNEPKIDIDPREVYLHEDLEKTVVQPDSITDAISYQLKACMDPSIEGINTDEIGYYSETDGNKLLVLLQVNDFKNTYTSTRKEIVYSVEDCLSYFLNLEDYQLYIGINGGWHMVLVKTPEAEDLGGRFAKSNLLLPFYGEPETKIEEVPMKQQ